MRALNKRTEAAGQSGTEPAVPQNHSVTGGIGNLAIVEASLENTIPALSFANLPRSAE